MNTTVASSQRRISLAAGIAYVFTFVSIPSISLYSSVKGANYVLSSGSNTSALIAGILEIVVALAGIATAVILFPILKKQNETLALGLVAARILESATIFVGVSFILAIVTLRLSGAGTEGLATSHALVALYNRIFLLGQSFMPAICDLLLGYMLYKSRLVPRGLAIIGIIGAPVLVVGWLFVLTGTIDRTGGLAKLSALLVGLFELGLGIWLIVKGFDTEAVATLEAKS